MSFWDKDRFLIDLTFGDKFAICVGYSAQYAAAGVFLYRDKQPYRSTRGRLWYEWYWMPVYRRLDRWHITPAGERVSGWRF